MPSPNELMTVKCLGCSRLIRVPVTWVQQGKVPYPFCSRACNQAHVRREGLRHQKVVEEKDDA